MSGCTTASVTEDKACSGKCKGGTCKKAPRVWIIAASAGVIALLERDDQGAFVAVQGEPLVFASLHDFQERMSRVEHRHAFDQLIIVGSSGDIAWIHASLPAYATCRITAEIEYPLLPAWFTQSPPLSLVSVLEGVFAT